MTARDDNHKPQGDVYEDRLLAYLDVLGFSKLIDESVNDGSKAAKILGLLTTLNKMCAQFESDNMSITLFSDTICISYHKPPNFVSFCCGLSSVVTSLLGQGYAVRGAVVRGKLYHKGNVIFGPCLVTYLQSRKTSCGIPTDYCRPTIGTESERSRRDISSTSF